MGCRLQQNNNNNKKKKEIETETLRNKFKLISLKKEHL